MVGRRAAKHRDQAEAVDAQADDRRRRQLQGDEHQGRCRHQAGDDAQDVDAAVGDALGGRVCARLVGRERCARLLGGHGRYLGAMRGRARTTGGRCDGDKGRHHHRRNLCRSGIVPCRPAVPRHPRQRQARLPARGPRAHLRPGRAQCGGAVGGLRQCGLWPGASRGDAAGESPRARAAHAGAADASACAACRSIRTTGRARPPTSSSTASPIWC
jgi:hypothetical protein